MYKTDSCSVHTNNISVGPEVSISMGENMWFGVGIAGVFLFSFIFGLFKFLVWAYCVEIFPSNSGPGFRRECRLSCPLEYTFLGCFQNQTSDQFTVKNLCINIKFKIIITS